MNAEDLKSVNTDSLYPCFGHSFSEDNEACVTGKIGDLNLDPCPHLATCKRL